MGNIAVVDLFCGVGGLSLGLRDSGLRIAAGIDLDAQCRFAYETNIGAKFLHRNVEELTPTELTTLYGDAEIKVLAACAPCQPFSRYTGKSRNGDSRWRLLLEVLRLAEAVKPEIVTVENVSRLAALPLWSEFCTSLRHAGYNVSWDVVDCASFGVPQRRKRLVLLASRYASISIPKPVSKPITVRAAIGKLPRIGAGKSSATDRLHASRALTSINVKRIQASVPNGSWKHWPKGLRADCHRRSSGKTYPSVYGRMGWDDPSPTITTQFYGFGNGRFGHPVQNRALTLREGAILQSFPTNFKFIPDGQKISFRAIGMMIGNAVPPKLAKSLGHEILAHAATFSVVDSLKRSPSR